MQHVTNSRRRALNAGRPSQNQILDQVGLAVIATDADGVVTTWNARAESLYRWARDEAIGRHVSELTVPDESQRSAEDIIAALQRGESWAGPFRVRRKDGSRFTSFVKNAPVLDEDRQLVGIVGISIEIADPDLADAVRAFGGNGTQPMRRSRALSPREREVLALLARGLTGEQIAGRLVLSPETVRTHIRNAREKLGASTRVEAVTMAVVAREIDI